MKRYTHLTENERYQIKALISLGLGVAKTAEYLKRSYSTIKRELKRNRGGCGYRPRQAHALAVARLCGRARDNARRIDQSTWDKVEEALKFQYSPEQISGRLKLKGEGRVSHEAIYRYVYADKRAGGTLWCHLRVSGLPQRLTDVLNYYLRFSSSRFCSSLSFFLSPRLSAAGLGS